MGDWGRIIAATRDPAILNSSLAIINPSDSTQTYVVTTRLSVAHDFPVDAYVGNLGEHSSRT